MEANGQTLNHWKTTVSRLTIEELNDEKIKDEILECFAGIYSEYNSRSRCYIYNVPIAFDIETSSFFIDGLKTACMYMFEVEIDGKRFAGRTWESFVRFCRILQDTLNLGKYRRVIIYVHNLAYEFQFMRKWFRWEKVFALDANQPVYAITDMGIEFRCSYILSGYSLAKLAEQCTMFPCRKMVGDLDYDKIRHSSTMITDTEWGYLDGDVDVVNNWIKEKLIREGGFSGIQLTKTSYVRVYTREQCQGTDRYDNKYKCYRDFIVRLWLDVDMYRMWNRGFQGGFTHASPYYARTWIDELSDSWDFISSYPYHLMLPEYPMGPGEWVEVHTVKELEKLVKDYTCVFDVEFEGLEAQFPYDFYLSQSHCFTLINPLVCNGRVMSADKAATTITGIDFDIIRRVYSWKHIKIGKVCRHRKGYLPKDFILGVLKLYADKTTLKNVEGKEIEYMKAKENVNSMYGSLVTAIDRPVISYDNDTAWSVEVPDLDKIFDSYNKNRNRVTYYPWGVCCTALARRSLWLGGITKFGKDYLYSDTDSCKVIHKDYHAAFIKEYNDSVDENLRKMCEHYDIDFQLTRPKDIKGIEHPLGQWDHDATYRSFKAIRAKAYMVEYEDGKMSLTVSGVNKKVAMPWLVEKYKTREEIFKHFDDDLHIEDEATGKLTHTYINEEIDGDVEDYTGKVGHFHEKSFIHLSKADYSMSLNEQYLEFLRGYKEVEI